LTDPGFDHTVLSEFRTRLVAGQAEQLRLETLLALVRERGLLKVRGRQRTDSTPVLAAIRVLNRLELGFDEESDRKCTCNRSHGGISLKSACCEILHG
jgi:hypothetical protein